MINKYEGLFKGCESPRKLVIKMLILAIVAGILIETFYKG